MKYTIKINQKVIAKEFPELDLKDAGLIDCLHVFSNSTKIQKKILDNVVYFWFDYNHIMKEMPLLKLTTEDSVYRRFKKLEKYNILRSHPENKGRGKSFYGFGDAYMKLFFDEENSDGNPNLIKETRMEIRENDPVNSDRNPNSYIYKEEHNTKPKQNTRLDKAAVLDFEKEEICRHTLEKNIKPTERIEFLQGKGEDFPTVISEIAKAFVLDGKELDPDKKWSIKGLLTYAKRYVENIPKEESEARVFKMVDRIDEVCSLFQKHMVRIPTERAKKAVSYKIRELMKTGETIEDFENAFSAARKGGGDVWKDLEYTIQNYERLKSLVA